MGQLTDLLDRAKSMADYAEATATLCENAVNALLGR
jgi:hypothetical protein